MGEVLETLTLYEKMELMASYSSVLIEQIALMMTALFAYLVACQFVGRDLSKLHAWSMTLIYSIFFWFGLVSYLGNGTRFVVLSKSYFEMGDGGSTLIPANIPIIVYGFGVLFTLAWIVSLLFLWDKRRVA